MRSSLVALVPAIGLCLSKVIEGPIDPRHHVGSQDETESICITYVTTYLATAEPGDSKNTGKETIHRKTKARCHDDLHDDN